MATRAKAVTQILRELGRDDGSAAARLMPLVYDELRLLAKRFFTEQPAGHTLQPTALVHEVYLRLVGTPGEDWTGREHFFAAAATAMRQILVDHARRRRAAKRGGGWQRITLDEAVAPSAGYDVDTLDLDEALRELAALDDRKARVVTMRFFGGLTNQAVANVLGVSRKTVAEDWTFARAWLGRKLRKGTEP